MATFASRSTVGPNEFRSNGAAPFVRGPGCFNRVDSWALSQLGAVEAVPKTEALVPAVPIRKSITPSFLICLDDGKKLKTLKRHLTSLGMTPDQYRAKWGLPDSYPMVAPEYAATRSALAKKSGLGQTAKRLSGRTSKAVLETAAS